MVDEGDPVSEAAKHSGKSYFSKFWIDKEWKSGKKRGMLRKLFGQEI